MKDKILKLCKRLKKCSLDEFVQFLEEDEKKIIYLLEELFKEKEIRYSSGYYFPAEKEVPKIENIDFGQMLMKISSEKFDLIIKCFCLEIPIYKAASLLNSCENSIMRFYNVFKTNIYRRQLAELEHYYNNEPFSCRIHSFFDTPLYFYVYDNKTFVSKRKLRSKKEKPFPEKYIKEACLTVYGEKLTGRKYKVKLPF